MIESDPEDEEMPPAEGSTSSVGDPGSSIPASVIQTYNMDTDISQLEAPTFTTLDRGPSQPMMNLDWDHRLHLIGKKARDFFLPLEWKKMIFDSLDSTGCEPDDPLL